MQTLKCFSCNLKIFVVVSRNSLLQLSRNPGVLVDRVRKRPLAVFWKELQLSLYYVYFSHQVSVLLPRVSQLLLQLLYFLVLGAEVQISKLDEMKELLKNLNATCYFRAVDRVRYQYLKRLDALHRQLVQRDLFVFHPTLSCYSRLQQPFLQFYLAQCFFTCQFQQFLCLFFGDFAYSYTRVPVSSCRHPI